MTDEEHARKYASESISLAISMYNPKAEDIAFFACLYGLTYKNNEIKELKQQIEKMKCCGNCNHFDFNEPNYCHKGVYRERQYVCSEWEFGN